MKKILIPIILLLIINCNGKTQNYKPLKKEINVMNDRKKISTPTIVLPIEHRRILRNGSATIDSLIHHPL